MTVRHAHHENTQYNDLGNSNLINHQTQEQVAAAAIYKKQALAALFSSSLLRVRELRSHIDILHPNPSDLVVDLRRRDRTVDAVLQSVPLNLQDFNNWNIQQFQHWLAIQEQSLDVKLKHLQGTITSSYNRIL